jgi:hypothetical protein
MTIYNNRTIDEKNLWLDDLSAAIRYAQSNLKKAGIVLEDIWYQPLWINETGITQCQSCRSSFKMFASKRHCRGW